MVLARIYELMGRLLMERPVRDKSLSELIATLERGGSQAMAQIDEARDEARNRETLRHDQWGALSIRGWLRYLVFHAEKDVKTLRR